MIKCVKCGELLGEELEECPFCRHRMSAEERRDALFENERLHFEAVQGAMEEYRRRIRTEIIVNVALILLAVLGTILILAVSQSEIVAIGFIALLGILTLGAVWRFRIGRCPYCECFMGQGMLWRTHCPRCGGRLR